MKKILSVVVAAVAVLIPGLTYAQSELTIETQYAFPAHHKAVPFIEATLEQAAPRGPGAFVFLMADPGFVSLGAGPLFTPEIRADRWYTSIAFGPSIDYSDHRVSLSGNGYVYLETMIRDERAAGKVVISSNHYYSPLYGYWNLSYGTYSFTKSFAAGLHYQSDVTTGIRLQLNLPAAFKAWGAVGTRGSAIIGLSYHFATE